MPLHSEKVKDVATCCNFKDVKTLHLHLDITVDFAKKQIFGVNEITLSSLKDELVEVSLDSHETLMYVGVKEKGEDAPLPFFVKPFTDYGTRLIIQLAKSKKKGEEFVLDIEFVATNGGGVCWFDPIQTADKKLPFLYTQGQAVLNRSFFPCQDTPAVKATYSATVAVGSEFTAVMSSNISSYGEIQNRKGNKNCFYFKQETPIPAYLIALAVGDLKSAKIGPRSSVWAEPSVLPRAQAEFDGEIEKFVAKGEELFGEYVWGRYDILVMPPSFPFGGMENPSLTYVTPCVVAGDKSLIDVVIHEISHSWFGNLITNANWSEFWLNEGFTMFAQRRLEEILYGSPFMCLEAATGQALLKRHIEQEGNDHPLTKLRVVIEPGVDPDDTYNETPYEKGYSFVCYLRHLAGGDNQVFDDFLKAYVKRFQKKSIVAQDLFDFYFEYFPHLKEQQVDKRLGFEFESVWLDGTGWPPYTPDLSDGEKLITQAEQAAAVFSSSIETNKLDGMETWTTYPVMYFLDKLNDSSPLPVGAMDKITHSLPWLYKSENAEIRLRWGELLIRNNYTERMEDIRSFLLSQGKQKYTKPLYQMMVKGSKDMQQLAVRVFAETRESLHVTVRGYVLDILQGAKLIKTSLEASNI